MKRVILTRIFSCGAGAALLLGSIVSSRADYASELLSMSPANFWRLNETGPLPPPIVATNLGSTGVAGDGVCTLNVTKDTAGPMADSSAAIFPGSATISVPYSSSLNPSGSLTVECWVKPVDINSGSRTFVQSMINGENTANADDRSGWVLRQNGASVTFLVGGTGPLGGSVYYTTTATTPAVLTPGVWSHVAAIYDSSTTNITIVVNGNSVLSVTGAAALIPNFAAPVIMGNRGFGGWAFNGSMSDVAIYGTGLTANDMKAHFDAATTNAAGYASQLLTRSPLAYWRLNVPNYVPLVAANTGTRGGAANGTYIPTIVISDGVRPPTYPGFEAANNAAVFDGAAGSVDCGTNASFAGQTDFSVMAWIKTTGTAKGIIAQQRDVDGVVPGYNGEYVLSANADGTVQFFVYKDGYQFDFFTPTTVNDGNWHQVVAERKGLDGLIYIDGELAGTAVGTEIKDLVPAIKTFIGRDMRDFVNTFNGSIDEVAMFDKALSQGAIASLYYTAIGSNAAPFMVSDPPVVNPATIYATTSFTIVADIAGALPMTYEWRKDGNLVGTSRDYTKANAAVADSGTYVVKATNPYGTVTSAAVTVTVNPAVPATITAQPVSRQVYAGGSASFSVTAEGTAPLSYQWKHAGTNLPGATTASLVVTNCTSLQAGAYIVAVTNVAGGVVSSTATLTLASPAAGTYAEQMITNGPVAFWRLNESGGPLAFDYAGGYDGTLTNAVVQAAVGPRPPQFPGLESANIGYQFDGTDASVQARSIGLSGPLTVSAWVNPNAFSGDRAIASELGSWAFKLSDNEVRFTTPGILDHGSSGAALTVGAWQNVVVSFEPGAAGGAKFYVNGRFISSTAASTLTRGNLGFWIGANQWAGQVFDGSIDEVAVYNKILDADTIARMYSVAAFGYNTAPFITAQPASQTVVVGGTATLTVVAQGSIPLSYQWKKANAPVAGATTSSFTIANASYSDAAAYSVAITNLAGTVNSAAASLSVLPAPTFANLTNDLVLHLRFDGNYADTSGRGNDATAPAGSPPFLAGKVGQGVHIASAANANYLSISDAYDDMKFNETNSFSVGFWLSYTAGFNDVPIIGNAVNSTWQLGWVLTDSATAGKIEWSVTSVANTGTWLRDPVPGCPTINDGKWHHVLAVLDRSTTTTSVYIDGVLASSWSIDGLGSLDSSYWPTIGSDPTGGYGAATFDMDDLGIWRRALTGYDALSIYNAAQGAGQSFDVYGPVKVSITTSGGTTTIAWQAGTLESNDDLSNPAGWTAVAGASAPTFTVTPSAGKKFYRVRL